MTPSLKTPCKLAMAGMCHAVRRWICAVGVVCPVTMAATIEWQHDGCGGRSGDTAAAAAAAAASAERVPSQ